MARACSMGGWVAGCLAFLIFWRARIRGRGSRADSHFTASSTLQRRFPSTLRHTRRFGDFERNILREAEQQHPCPNQAFSMAAHAKATNTIAGIASGRIAGEMASLKRPKGWSQNGDATWDMHQTLVLGLLAGWLCGWLAGWLTGQLDGWLAVPAMWRFGDKPPMAQATAIYRSSCLSIYRSVDIYIFSHLVHLSRGMARFATHTTLLTMAALACPP